MGEGKTKTKPRRTYRTTRIVCVSDTHGYTPSQAGFKLPPGDVLIHAGDLTNQGSMSELLRTVEWISAADYEVKIVVAGNHDITLDPAFYAQHGPRFHNQRNLEDPSKCIQLLTTASPSIIFLNHSSTTIRLTRPDGPKTTFKVFGSPYSRFHGVWAFGYESTDADKLWDQIPPDTDIVVTHTPPYSHCDRWQRDGGVSGGCEGLRQALRRVRPMLAVCGHVHDGRGYERVRWDVNSSSSPENNNDDDDDDNASEEEQTEQGTLPPLGSKKQCLVDLTGKKQRRLDNDGCLQTEDAPHNSLNHEEDGGRWRRKETCIVNAAIMATSWPHKGGKKFHTPIVVDLELPVWNEEEELET